ncbi:hypothetical protein TRFO_27167 [Tritrichomonas foetus]|uniref:Importin subunit beta-1/Transportin-1-like TPR repeats domain-containing protein n=1 Tax=Tritrichomonas foetus TaxID=1144522 RepID=A0A1J4K693_9EUKA|nr:hypothetical protein TRFO_27167 [Tritrichomonas foetus]|eukprot:OHT05220.1 hypothetical protein TRFO_27167 [Tritrichomonas foetus]
MGSNESVSQSSGNWGEEKENKLIELIEKSTDLENGNLLSDAMKKDPISVYDNCILLLVKEEDMAKQFNYSVIIGSILPESVPPETIVFWMNHDNRARIESMKRRLYLFVQQKAKSNEIGTSYLKNLALSIAHIAFIEYSQGAWQNDFDLLLDNVGKPENNYNTNYTYLSILQYLLNHNIPRNEDGNYDVRVSTICSILNNHLIHDIESNNSRSDYNNNTSRNSEESDNESISCLIFECLKKAIQNFNKFFNNIPNCCQQMDQFLNIMKNNNNSTYNIRNTKMCYQCLKMIAKYRYNFIFCKMQEIFSLSIPHLQNEILREYSIQFWKKIASVEYQIDPRLCKRFTLGVIPYIHENILHFITLTDPNDFDPDDINDGSISSISEKCLIAFSKIEQEKMFSILSEYYLNHNQDIKSNNKRAALVAFRCLVYCDEGKFIFNHFNEILEFAKSVNEKLKFIAIDIIDIILKKYAHSIVYKDDNMEELIKLVKTNVNSHPLIISQCFSTFTTILSLFSSFEHSIIYFRFDEFYQVIEQAINLDNESAFDSLKMLIERAPKECNEKIFQILKSIIDYISQIKDDYSFTTARKIDLIPIIVDKLQNQISEVVPLIIKTIITLLKNSSREYHELFEALLSIIPYTSNQIKFAQFGKQLLPILYEHHEANDPNTMPLTTKIIASLFDTFAKELPNYLNQVIQLFLKDLNNDYLLPQVYPSIFQALSALIKIAGHDIIQFQDSILSKLEIFASFFCEKEIYHELIKHIIDTYASLFEVFQDDQEFIKKTEKKVLMLMKKIERIEMMDEEILEISIKIIFIVVCSLGPRAFAEIRQLPIQAILKKGLHCRDEIVSSTSGKILNVIQNYV